MCVNWPGDTPISLLGIFLLAAILRGKDSSFPHFFRQEKVGIFPDTPNLMPLSPGPSPGISGASGSFLQLVSDLAVPGSLSTRPWSSHLWRKGEAQVKRAYS